MRILYLTEEPPLSPQRPAAGNQVRMAMLAEDLAEAGLEVELRHAENPDHRQVQGWIDEIQPEAILLGYWKLAEHLPASLEQPVIIDCIAPRVLEHHFEDAAVTAHFIHRYQAALQHADLVLVGNEAQRWLMVSQILGAGIDLTAGDPVAMVPLGIRPRAQARSDHRQPLIAVHGGRHWPWRDARRWLQALANADGEFEIHAFGDSGVDHPSIQLSPLLSWQDWQDFLEQRAHVGIELADRNLEREASQSFRVIQYLQAGLPVIINDFLPLAERVKQHDAGWVVDSPEAAAKALSEAVSSPASWRAKAEGAARLGQSDMSRQQVIQPLLEWLKNPHRRSQPHAESEQEAPRTMARDPSLLGLFSRIVLRPFMRQVEGDGVVIASRSDLFPTDHGAAVKIIETARALARLGRPVGIITADRETWLEVSAGSIETRPLPWWLRVLALPRAFSHLLHRLRGLPASNAFLYWPLIDPGYGLRAAWVGRRIGATTCLAEFPGFAQAARICRLLNGGRAVLAEHNVEYQRLKDQVGELSDRQYEKLKRIELKMANTMDAVVCVSTSDRRRLIADGIDPASISLIPHGVDLPGFDQAEPEDLKAHFGLDPERPILVYHGTFSYPPNRQALMVFIDELLPRLTQRGHRAQLLGIGSHPPRAMDHPDLALPGSLDTLAGFIKAADLAVVPLTSGGGTRMKILDYFAAGKAVISTSKGCEGLPVADGRELLIRDDWDRFADAVAALLEDPDHRQRIAAGGRKLAESLDWLEIGRLYDRLFRRIDGGSASASEAY